MKRSLSIQWRLAFQFSLTVLLILCLSGGLVFYIFTQKAQRDIDNLLFIQYTNIRNSLKEHFVLFHDPDLRDETFQRINAEKQIDLLSVIINRQGRVIEKTSSGKVTLKWKEGYSNGSVDHQPYRYYMGDEGGMKVIVGENLEAYEKNVRSLALILLTVMGVMFLLSFSLSALFAKRALAPLRILHDKVRGLGPHNLPTATLASAYGGRDEIGRLASTFDEFLARLSHAFEREKQFTQDASHELRTPLTVLKSSLELLNLNCGSLDESQRSKLATMGRSLIQMENLVNDLLFLSRGLSPRQKREPIPVAAFLKKFIELFRIMAHEKKLKLRFKIVRDFTLNTSIPALEKTVGNLIKNAIQYTEKGSVTLIADSPDIVVRDTGIGVSEKDQPHIFERFFQANAARGGESRGFGLGLAICKEICDREGWKIKVESAPCKGSVFILETKPFLQKNDKPLTE